MNRKIALLAALGSTAIAVSASAAQLNVADVRLDIPDTWAITGDPTEFPLEITHSGGDAELLIFRTDLEPNQTISTADELKQSVQKAIDSVILSLPNSKLLTNTGYSEPERTGFALEFIAVNPDDGTVLRHRLFGWLYKHPDGHQILFTLWGKGALRSYPQYENDVRQMQAAFEYTGPHEEIVLSSNSHGWGLPALVILMTVAGLLYYRSARNGRSRMIAFEDSGWRCSCGVRNSPSMHQCRQCGQPRVAARVRQVFPEVPPAPPLRRTDERTRS